MESWLLKSIDRNNFPPNLGGVRMWQAERRRWQAARLTSIMQEAGGGSAEKEDHRACLQGGMGPGVLPGVGDVLDLHI